MANVSVIGSGTWGTALAILLCQNGHQVTLWSALESEVSELANTRIHKNLPKVRIPDEIAITGDLACAMQEKDLLVLAVPSVFVRTTCQKMRPYLTEGQIVVNVSKGIEDGTLMTMTEIMEEEMPGVVAAALSGPSHAEEVSIGLPTTCVAAAHKRHAAELVQSLFMSKVFRVYTSPDLKGVELGGSLKNVVALAAGIADGLGCGDNTKAALITRGIAEISRLGTRMGASAQTFSGLSGIGDLIVTCASMHSRNRRAGILIGQGYTMEEAMKEVNMVVEGVYSAKAALALASKYNVPMPIVEQVNDVLFHGCSALEAVTNLMLRDRCVENPGMEWEEA